MPGFVVVTGVVGSRQGFVGVAIVAQCAASAHQCGYPAWGGHRPCGCSLRDFDVAFVAWTVISV